MYFMAASDEKLQMKLCTWGTILTSRKKITTDEILGCNKNHAFESSISLMQKQKVIRILIKLRL